MQEQTVRHGWERSSQQGNKYVLDGTDGAQFLRPPLSTRRRRTRKQACPTTCRLRPFLSHPDPGCNEIHYGFFHETKYYILSDPPRPCFFPLSHSPNANTHEGKNQYKAGKKKKVKQSAIYQHWISESGPEPVSPACWDLTLGAGAGQGSPEMIRLGAPRVCQTWQPVMELITG